MKRSASSCLILFLSLFLALAGCSSISNQTVGAAAPSITAQPTNATGNLGQPANFSVAATGTLPLNYQWRKNSANISGATAASAKNSSATVAHRLYALNLATGAELFGGPATIAATFPGTGGNSNGTTGTFLAKAQQERAALVEATAGFIRRGPDMTATAAATPRG